MSPPPAANKEDDDLQDDEDPPPAVNDSEVDLEEKNDISAISISSETDDSEDIDEEGWFLDDEGFLQNANGSGAGPKLLSRWMVQHDEYQKLLHKDSRTFDEELRFDFLFSKFSGDTIAARAIRYANYSPPHNSSAVDSFATAADATSSSGDLEEFNDTSELRNLSARSVSFSDLRYTWTKKEREQWMKTPEEPRPGKRTCAAANLSGASSSPSPSLAESSKARKKRVKKLRDEEDVSKEDLGKKFQDVAAIEDLEKKFRMPDLSASPDTTIDLVSSMDSDDSGPSVVSVEFNVITKDVSESEGQKKDKNPSVVILNP